MTALASTQVEWIACASSAGSQCNQLWCSRRAPTSAHNVGEKNATKRAGDVRGCGFPPRSGQRPVRRTLCTLRTSATSRGLCSTTASFGKETRKRGGEGGGSRRRKEDKNDKRRDDDGTAKREGSEARRGTMGENRRAARGAGGAGETKPQTHKHTCTPTPRRAAGRARARTIWQHLSRGVRSWICIRSSSNSFCNVCTSLLKSSSNASSLGGWGGAGGRGGRRVPFRAGLRGHLPQGTFRRGSGKWPRRPQRGPRRTPSHQVWLPTCPPVGRGHAELLEVPRLRRVGSGRRRRLPR